MIASKSKQRSRGWKEGCCCRCIIQLGWMIYWMIEWLAEGILFIASSKFRIMVAIVISYAFLSTTALFIAGFFENSAVAPSLWNKWIPDELSPTWERIRLDLLDKEMKRKEMLKLLELERDSKREEMKLKGRDEWEEISTKSITDSVLIEKMGKHSDIDRLFQVKGDYLGDIKNDWSQAYNLYKKANELNPLEVNYLANMAWALLKLNRGKEAMKCLWKSYEIRPTYGSLVSLIDVAWKLNDWEKYDWLHGKVLEGAREGVQRREKVWLNPYLALHLPLTLEELKWISRGYSMSHDATDIRYMSKAMMLTYPKWDGKRKIRVGYVSPDIRNHAVGIQIRSMFEYHDHDSFEIFVYSVNEEAKMPDHVYAKVNQTADRLTDIHIKEWSEAAKRINDDQCDILIDLALFTAYSRMDVFAAKPAPIQVAWLGLAVTTGAPHYDYIIADQTVIPEESFPHYSEKVVWMPHSYHIFDHKQFYGLPSSKKYSFSQYLFSTKIPTDQPPPTQFFFCNHQNNYRLDPQIIYHWTNILKRTNGTTLIIKHQTDESTDEVKKQALSFGISTEVDTPGEWPRLLFMRGGGMDHIHQKSICNLYIDIPKYNGHSTSGDMLWAGVPVLTLPLESMASRAAASFIKTSGIPELIADSWEDYEEKAVWLSSFPPEYFAFRKKIEDERMTNPLFDTFLFVKHLEEAFEEMMRIRYAEKSNPRHFQVQNLQSTFGAKQLQNPT
eukprot:TRINITY_DN5192_c0_g1_i6.p1 TRINITY_DN5192_c0_g1~~TRINITY_DN5192_c0_g1_i6.p1  ORF type:complete len:726 (-),score=143.54 TRINITY_DN5192_c0_g1_i6:8-2185(-)